MHVRRIHDPDELSALLRQNAALMPRNPMLRAAWLDTWWRHYSGGLRDGALFALAVYENDQLLAVAPWYVEHASVVGQVVRFIGGGDVCPEYQTLLCVPGYEQPVAQAIADWLLDRQRADRDWHPRGEWDSWDLVELENVDAADPAITCLHDELADRGGVVDRSGSHVCWRLELPKSWDAYMAMLSKSRRKHMRRLERSMLDSGRAVVQHVTSEAQLARGFEVLVQLHNERWRRRGIRGAFEDPRFQSFHRDATARMLAEGALRLLWLEIDGRPVAAEYVLTDGQGRYAYQGGIDPDALEEEPGTLAAIVMLRQAIAEGCVYYDFLRGDEEYKAHLRAQPRPIVTLRLWATRPSVRWRRRVWQAIDTSRRTRRSVRQWLKSRLQGGNGSRHLSHAANQHESETATIEG